MNRITIFANYRTGSSYLASKISTETNTQNLGEILHQAPNGINLFDTSKELYSSLGEANYFDSYFDSLRQKERTTMKFMADHTGFDRNKIQQILNNSDKIIYCYRRDFKKTITSMLAGIYLKKFGSKTLEDAHHDFLRKKFPFYKQNSISKKNTGTPEYFVKKPKDQDINRCIEVIIKNYLMMGEFYKSHPGELHCLEDATTGEPYNRKIIWDEEPVIPDFEVEALFKK